MSYVRTAALFGALGTSLFLAACGGNSGVAPPLRADNPAGLDGGATRISLATSVYTPPPTSSYTFHIQGPIVAVLSATEFQINGGKGVGYLHVFTNSSTKMNLGGAKPAAGQSVDAYGTGSAATSMTASVVNLDSSTTGTSSATSSTPPPAGSYTAHVKGPITAVISSTEFQINGGSGVGYLHVYTTGSTTKNLNGLALSVGNTVDAYGSGSASTSVTATWLSLSSASTVEPTAAPVASGSVPTHVMTAGIYGYGGTPLSIAPSSMAPYLTWAQTQPTSAAALRAAGIKVDVYMNFWKNYTSDSPAVGFTDLKPGGVHAGAELKNCSTGSVYKESIYGGGYVSNALTSAAAAHAEVVAAYRESEFGGNYDAIFSDDTGALDGDPLPCGYTYSGYQTATNNVHAALGKKIFVNTINAGTDIVGQVNYTNASNVIGAMCESCLSYWATNAAGTAYDAVRQTTKWEDEENAEALMVSRHKIYWAYGRAIGDAATETPLRIYTYASFLLTYDPNYAMLQEVLKTPSGFEVFPETGLVPMQPVTTSTTVSGYLRSGGAYMREFGACYYRGVAKGKCAVVINTSYTSSATIPTTAYKHAMTLSGSGVLDGGSAAFSATAPTSLAEGTAAILFQ